MKLQGSMKGVRDNYTSALTRALVQAFGVHRFIYHDNRILAASDKITMQTGLDKEMFIGSGVQTQDGLC